MGEGLTKQQRLSLLSTLETRFKQNQGRHPTVVWEDVIARLESYPKKLWSLYMMEKTGGEPDVVGYDEESDTYLFYDCSAETPLGRRGLCYDREGWLSRKSGRPKGDALGMAASMGVELLDENQYIYLQSLGSFDTRTSSWLKTPHEVRKLGGALFGDRRFGRVFIYHNTASSYYSSRGWRGVLVL